MRRFTARLFCTAVMLGLTAVGFAKPPGQPKQEEKKAAAAAANFIWRVEPAVGANDAMIQQFEQQYGPQVRLMLRTEMHFLRLVTQPTKPQYEKIAADGEAALKAAIPRYTEALFMRANNINLADPRAPITEALAKSVRANLSGAQSARYDQELLERAGAQKRFAVSSLVLMVDKALLLSPQQRSELGIILENNWDNVWNETSMFVMNNCFPPMPDAKITPILSDVQQAVWRGIAKGNIRFGFSMGIVQFDIADEVWDDDRPPKPANGPGAVHDKAIPKAGEKK